MSEFSLTLTEEQTIIQDSARKFATQEIAPVASECDRKGELPEQLIRRAGDLGFLNMTIPEAFGGTGLSNLNCCLVVEELAWGCGGITTSCVANDLALTPIVIAGTDAQREAFISPITKEKKLASFCLSEPNAGSDVAGMSARG